MFRKLVVSVFTFAAVLTVMMAQAGSYLLALPSPGSDARSTAGSGFSAPGPYLVGLGHLDDETTTLWYPTDEEADAGSITYSFGFNMMGPETSITLATYQGSAISGAEILRPADPFPLVVLSHGFAITASSYAWIAEHLASWGFVVVAPHHHEALDPGSLWRSTIDRPNDVDDVRAMVERASRAGGMLEGVVDHTRVAVVGHSYGGYTALASAGASIDMDSFRTSCDGSGRAGQPLEFLCGALVPRLSEISAGGDSGAPNGGVDAVVAISGDAAMFGETGLSAISVPVMTIGGTADADSPFEWSTRLAYENVSSARKAEVAFDGAGHLVFAGRCEKVRRVLSLAPMGFCDDVWDRAAVHEVVKDRVAAFLLAELTGDSRAAASLSRLDPQVDGVSYRSEGY